MFLNLPYIFWVQMALLFLPVVIVGVLASVILMKLRIQAITKGAFHIENGILFTHGIISKNLPISEIENIEVHRYLLTWNGKKCLINIKMRNGTTAGFLITHNIETELERFKQELSNSGYDIDRTDKWRE